MLRSGVVRFPLVVLPTAFWVRAGFIGAVTVGAWTLVLDPGGGQLNSALASILLLQMFAVSNGFAPAAARGHFDPVLVSGRSRVAVALGAGAAAALPGAAAWGTMLVLAAASGEPIASVAAPHRQAAFIVVSGVGWAAGVALPRFAAGALWCLLLVGLALSDALFDRHLVLIRQAPSSVQDILLTASACVVCPFVFLGDFAGPIDWRVIALALMFTAAAVGLACVSVVRRDYGLTERE